MKSFIRVSYRVCLDIKRTLVRSMSLRLSCHNGTSNVTFCLVSLKLLQRPATVAYSLTSGLIASWMSLVHSSHLWQVSLGLSGGDLSDHMSGICP